MEINARLIKNLRQEKTWTQQHLADACGLNLRTIQRIESEGSASNESVQALCAVFQIQRQALSIIPVIEPSELQPVSKAPLRVAFFSLVIGIVFGCAMTYLLLKFGR